MLAGLLGVLGFLTVRGRFDDPDMWWHLKTGEITWTTHRILTTDIFSYTTNHHPYIPHEWLSQLLIYSAYRIGGYPGLMLWMCLATAAVLIAGYALCTLYSGHAKVAFVGALTIWAFGTVGFAVRPHMIGYLLLIVEMLLLELGRTRNPRWFFGLPPLFAIWVNCHGSFFLGMALAGVTLFSSYFEFRSGLLTATRWDHGPRRTLTIALILSVGALFLNPSGARLIWYPINTLAKQSVSMNVVSEWQPIQLGDARGHCFLGVLAAIFLVAIVRRSELYWRELLLIAMATWMAAGHQRLLFPFGIIVGPILARLLASSWEGYDPERDLPLPNAVLIAASFVVAFLAFPSRQNLEAQADAHSPVKAVAFLKDHHLPGPLLNEWADGGYLIWTAPEYPVFIDGRADVFEWTGVLQEYGKWSTLQNDPNILLDKYQINLCLLNRDASMAGVLSLLPRWKTVYSDDKSVIFQRISPSAQSSSVR
jgi:hypothetical protein